MFSLASIQVIFDAELGNSFSGVALDDISVLEGTCIGGMSSPRTTRFAAGTTFIPAIKGLCKV